MTTVVQRDRLKLSNRLNKKEEVYILQYKIKAMRENKKMSQEALSEKAGVSRTIISRLESGEKVVTTTETLLKIANALECKVSDIFLS